LSHRINLLKLILKQIPLEFFVFISLIDAASDWCRKIEAREKIIGNKKLKIVIIFRGKKDNFRLLAIKI